MKVIEDLFEQIDDLRRRVAGLARAGIVESVDPAAGTVRLRFDDGDGSPYLSASMPYAQMAGALKVHTPPSVGQQMVAVAPAGDLRNAIAQPYGWSDANGAPSASGDEVVVTFGSATMILEADKLTLAVGGTSVVIDVAGVSITGDFEVSGGKFEHEGKNVGKDHLHSGVTAGPSNSGEPI